MKMDNNTIGSNSPSEYITVTHSIKSDSAIPSTVFFNTIASNTPCVGHILADLSQPLIKLRSEAVDIKDSIITVVDTITINEQLYGVTGYKVNSSWDGHLFMIIGTEAYPIVPFIATGEILIPLDKPLTLQHTSPFRIVPMLRAKIDYQV